MNVDDLDIEELRQRLMEAEGNLHAIYSGEIDALLLADERGERRVFTLRSADALKFSLSEKPVQVSVTCEGGDAVLRVSDQGVGIPADMLPRIFDLFVQAHHTIDRSRGGLGIGLTLVRRLAEMHGDQVEASSESKGRGRSTAACGKPARAAGGRQPRLARDVSRRAPRAWPRGARSRRR